MDRSSRMRALLGNHDTTFTKPEQPLQQPSIPDSWDLEAEEDLDSKLAASTNSFAQLCLAQEADDECFSHSDDDEKVLNIEHTVGGRFAQPLEKNNVEEKRVKMKKYEIGFGDEVGHEESFCLMRSLVRFPYDHMSKAHRSRVARKYFEKGQVYEREWDFFYIYPPQELDAKPLLLVPTMQVEQFLHHINFKLKTYLKLPDAAEYPTFATTFSMDGAPRPRYLGKSTEREMAEGLKLSVPARSWRSEKEVAKTRGLSMFVPDQAIEVFHSRMEILTKETKAINTPNKVKKAVERQQKRQAWGRQIKRVERYLGLKEARETGDEVNQNMPDLQSSQTRTIGHQHRKDRFRLDRPAPYAPEDSVVFICVDVEADEHDHNKITEIGFAILDTADLVGISPGTQGRNWMNAIRGTHFRTTEYQHIINRDFMQGCPDQFQFGQSQFVNKDDLAREIAKCFRPPYTRKNGTVDEPVQAIVLVGHDVGSDVKFLKIAGYDVHNLSNLQEEIDTSCMYRALKKEPNPRNLGSCLANLELMAWCLHNAGNDAVYTMQVMVAIALKDMDRQQAKEIGREVEMSQEPWKSRADPEQNVKETYVEAGWSSDDADDGGVAIPMVRVFPKRKGTAWSPDSSPQATHTSLPTEAEMAKW